MTNPKRSTTSERHRPLPKNIRTITGAKPAPVEPEAVQAPACPSWLSDGARRIWQRTARLMVESGSWRDIYRDALSVYCTLQSQFEADPSSFTAAQITQLRLYAQELALTPASEKKPSKRGSAD